MKQYRLNIDGKEVLGVPGQTILEVARENDISIPTLCYDERTTIYGACGLCVVEVEGNPKLVKACATEIAPNMVVRTKTKRVLESRKTNLELLLSTHVGDCRPPCVLNCPAGTDCQGYVGLIANGRFEEAIALIRERIPLPGSIGRVCPHPCEDNCRRALVDQPVAIAWLKRFAADWDQSGEDPFLPEIAPETGRSVAIIGGGPYGLSAAYFLRQMGHAVTIFEAMPKLGGMLRYGIPEYRLPKSVVDEEVATIARMGVTLRPNTRVGKDISFETLRETYDAVLVGVGAWVSTGTGCPGEELPGVVGGIDFLRHVVRNEPIALGKRVAIVGGGNTAMDAARAALRAGAKTSTLVYRRTKKYMPADAEELELAVEDGVRFLELVAPVEQANGKLKCEVMKLGDPDEKGRRSPVPTGEFTEINCDTVIAAVGERVDSDLFTANGIEVNAKGIPEFRTNLENVFVGGDAMRGPATVVEGIADAQYFANAVIGSVHSVAIPDDAHATRDEAFARKGVLCPPKAGCEGERCLHCNTVCQVCADVCPNRANVVITLPDGRHEILHVDRMCNECGNCAVFCPYDSAPYRNKFTLFLTREGFDESTENQGFLPLEGRKVLVRLDGKVFEADLDGQNQLPADVETFILTVLKDYAYLL